MIDSCPKHRFPTSPTEWEFKLSLIFFIARPTAKAKPRIAFLNRQQMSAKCEFKLANLANIFHRDPSQNPTNLPKASTVAINLLQKLPSPPGFTNIYSLFESCQTNIFHRGLSKTRVKNSGKQWSQNSLKLQISRGVGGMPPDPPSGIAP